MGADVGQPLCPVPNLTNAKGKKAVVMTMKEADLEDAEPINIQLKKRGPTNVSMPNAETAPDHKVTEKRNAMKVVSFHDKWKKLIPPEYHAEMCPEPSDAQRDAAKEGKKGTGKAEKEAKRRKMDELEVQAMETTKRQKTTHQEAFVDEADCDFGVDEGSDDEMEDICLAKLAKLMEENKDKRQNENVSDVDDEFSDSDDEVDNIPLSKLK